jgi:FkbM family methyltransferase
MSQRFHARWSVLTTVCQRLRRIAGVFVSAERKFHRLTKIDRQRLEFYSQFVRPGDVVFDVGANMGNRTKIFLRLGARTVAFEPQMGCAEFLGSVLLGHPNFRLVRRAVGAEVGEMSMLINDANTLSSLSPGWVRAVQDSGRFGSFCWDRQQLVQVTTLDQAILEFGVPAFVKIDVEGFERQVLAGLSRPVATLSFEFTPEFIDNAIACVDRAASLSDVEFNFSFGESMRLEFERWICPHEMKVFLTRTDRTSFGDVYVRMPS